MNRRLDSAWVVPAIASHVDVLARCIRESDRREIEAAFGRPAAVVLRSGYRNAKRCWSVLAGGRPVAMFGVGRRAAPRIGTVWLLASDDFGVFRGQLRREGPYWVDVLMAGHDVLANFVAADNRIAVRWLAWLGFELLALHRGVGTRGEDFWEFAAFRAGVRGRYLGRVPPSSPAAAAGSRPSGGGENSGVPSSREPGGREVRPPED